MTLAGSATRAVSTPVLRTTRLSKRFPGVLALDQVSFELREQEVHALCGENGAGKSTLIKTLSGIHPHGSYTGEIELWGAPARFAGIRDAERAGLSVIYQELALVEDMTVAENIFLGCEPLSLRLGKRFGLIDWARAEREAAALLAQFGMAIDPGSRIRDLGVGQRQLVEIAKALRKQTRLLILDEPTAALTTQEAEILLDILRALRERGIASIYISHKLEEVFAIADRITVLRDGKSIATHEATETSVPEVIRQMVGRSLGDVFNKRGSKPASRGLGAPRLRVEGLSAAERPRMLPRLREISFAVHEGEVLGIGGLMGAGRSELVMHLFGAWGVRLAGQVLLDSTPLCAHTPAESIRRGLVLVSEDRKQYGLVLEHSVGFNLSLSNLAAFTRHGIIAEREEHAVEQQFVKRMQIKTHSLETEVATLSGGNQQKVVLGKALMTEPRVVLLDEPTRGIDVGAKFELYELIQRMTDEGTAVVLVSSELPELLGLSDRILMLAEGRQGGEFTREEATQEKLMAAAMGNVGVESS